MNNSLRLLLRLMQLLRIAGGGNDPAVVPVADRAALDAWVAHLPRADRRYLRQTLGDWEPLRLDIALERVVSVLDNRKTYRTTPTDDGLDAAEMARRAWDAAGQGTVQ